MAASILEAATLSFFSTHHPPYSKFILSPKPPPLSINLLISNPTPLITHSFPQSSLTQNHRRSKNLCFQLCSTVQEVTVETTPEEEEIQEANLKRKLFVVNLPWSFSVVDIKDLFGQCGTVSDVEIIKQKNGRSRGFAFVTMTTGEEAQAAIDKFDSLEVSGRIIRVEFAKRLRRPSPRLPGTPADIPAGETRHKLYISNLAWKVRGSHLREFFSTNFNPVSSRVVFDGPAGRSSGYGFVSFSTREEAVGAISAFNGKELMGRPIRLKFSEDKADEPETEKKEEETSEVQLEEK
ncbi:hypothetical protein SADUNF_Sadunf01G0115500 [Salix dunnii]|uniref:RRM domain-containing protein n=1 Tax=Salix dunnii TaxID=1413687 RepID=A0A835NBB1_9ROSI|nr:hypothetical protein SADUNF_Sadunf01G0115500 [Salix dunnii]